MIEKCSVIHENSYLNIQQFLLVGANNAALLVAISVTNGDVAVNYVGI